MNYIDLKELALNIFQTDESKFDSKTRDTRTVYARMSIVNILHRKGYNILEITEMTGLKKVTIMRLLRSFDERINYDYDFRYLFNKFEKEVV